jgi:hypothetical protein
MRVVGPRNGRAKEGGGARGLISKYWGLKMERGEGRWAGAAGVSVGTGQGRGKEGEAGGRRRGHRQVWPACERQQEKEKRRKRRRAAAGEGEWAGGPAGLEREVRSFSIFSLFPFQTLLKFKPFQLKFIQNFSNLFTKLYIPF